MPGRHAPVDGAKQFLDQLLRLGSESLVRYLLRVQQHDLPIFCGTVQELNRMHTRLKVSQRDRSAPPLRAGYFQRPQTNPATAGIACPVERILGLGHDPANGLG